MSEQITELLLQPDGIVLVHNLTPAMAELLAGLDPNNEEMRRRATPESPVEASDAKNHTAAAS